MRFVTTRSLASTSDPAVEVDSPESARGDHRRLVAIDSAPTLRLWDGIIADLLPAARSPE